MMQGGYGVSGAVRRRNKPCEHDISSSIQHIYRYDNGTWWACPHTKTKSWLNEFSSDTKFAESLKKSLKQSDRAP